MEVKTFGRGPQNDVDINDPRVSRKHCQIINDNGGFVIRDLGSTNGTYVNGSRINGERSLSLYDTVRIGDTDLSWRQYFDDTDDDGTDWDDNGTECSTNVGNWHADEKYDSYNYNYNDSNDNDNNKTNSNYSIITFVLGAFSIACIAYIVLHFLNAGGTIFGTEFALRIFPLYLKGYHGVGGQWFPMIVALIAGGAADFVDGVLDDSEDENKFSKVGTYLANAGVSMSILFIILAIFAENIAQM